MALILLSLMSMHILLTLFSHCNCQRDYRSSFFILRRDDKDAFIASNMKDISSCFFQCSDIPGCEVVPQNTKTGACSVEESKEELNKEAGKHN